MSKYNFNVFIYLFFLLFKHVNENTEIVLNLIFTLFISGMSLIVFPGFNSFCILKWGLSRFCLVFSLLRDEDRMYFSCRRTKKRNL